MTPFVTDIYFYFMILLTIPAVILGLSGRKIKYYGLFVSLLFVFFVFDAKESLTKILLFVVYSYGIALLYEKLVTDKKNKKIFFVFCVLIFMPLLLSKGVFGVGRFSLMGLSYLSFRTFQFIQELSLKRLKKLNFTHFLYFVLFFPAVSSGPIDRYARFEKELNTPLTKEAYFLLLKEGIWKFMIGLLYSFGVAKVINAYVLVPVGTLSGLSFYVLYMYGYTFYLFFNFAGYSNMAIGISYMFGVKMPENFNKPFFAVDLKDFWTRWHISLSTFFRDYIYNRYVMDALMKKRFKNPKQAAYVGYLITMFVMGIWHGFQLHYILYGIYHGILMTLNSYLDDESTAFKNLKKSKWGSVFCTLVTFHLVAFGLLLFSGKIV